MRKNGKSNTPKSPPCHCGVGAIVGCECSHRPRHAQRARLVAQAVATGLTWPQIESTIRQWHDNLAELGLSRRVVRNPSGEMQRALRDSRKLYWQFNASAFSTTRPDQVCWRGLTPAEGRRLIHLTAEANVRRRYAFARATFRLLRLYKSLKWSPWAGINGSLPISSNLIRKSLGVNWRCTRSYILEWKRLGLLRLRRRANRQKRECRIFSINFPLRLDFNGNPPRRVSYSEEFDDLDKLLEYLLSTHQITLRQLIALLGNSPKLRQISKILGVSKGGTKLAKHTTNSKRQNDLRGKISNCVERGHQ